MIRITTETSSFTLSEIASSLSTALDISVEQLTLAFHKVLNVKSTDELSLDRSKLTASSRDIKRNCSHIYTRGANAGIKCDKQALQNGLCGSHQPRSKAKLAESGSEEKIQCDAIVKSGQRKGEVCGKTCTQGTKCSSHLPKSQDKELSSPSNLSPIKCSPEQASPSADSPSRIKRRENDTAFDFHSDPIVLEDNIEWWKPQRNTEIDGKTYKQHRATRLLLSITNTQIKVSGLMVHGKPVWREELDNHILEWCKKSGLD